MYVFALIIPCLLLSISAQAQDWLISIEAAKAQASQEDNKILLVFQGSDWCAPCIKMEHNVWSQDAFKTYAKSNLVLLKADFPKRKNNKLDASQQEHNDALAKKYNQQGIFPLVVIMDQEGNVLGETGYKKYDSENYIEHIKSILIK